MRWWQWRRRRERIAQLERIAGSRIVLRNATGTVVDMTMEQAYLVGRYGGAVGRPVLPEEWIYGPVAFRVIPDRGSIFE